MEMTNKTRVKMDALDDVSLPAQSSAGSAATVQASQPIRLMKALPLFASGGTEGQVMNLVRRLDPARYDIRFACFKRWGCFLEELEERRIPVDEYRIKSLYKPGTFRQIVRLAMHMRREGIQVAHSYNFYANAFMVPAAKLAGVPVVIASIRDRGVYLTPAQRHLQRWVCRLADRILVNTGAIRDWLVEDDYPAGKILTIPNGIDLSRYGGRRRSGIRESFGLPADAPLVTMLSRLNPQKGVDDFIRAAALVSRRHPDARFLIVGEKLHYKNGAFSQDEDYHGYLRRLSLDLGLEDKLIFTGHRADVPDVLGEAHLSVLPSHSEGLSNTLLESMAAGLPVVATDVGGNPELIRHGENGLLVPPRAPEALGEAINAILDDPALAERFGRASRERAENRYSMQGMVDKTEDVYVSMLAKMPSKRSLR